MKNVHCLLFLLSGLLLPTEGTSQAAFEFQLDSTRTFGSNNVTRYSYNSDGSCARSEYASFNASEQQLQLVSETWYTYTSSGLIQEVNNRQWNDSLGAFVDFKKRSYTYDEEDRLLQDLTIGFSHSDLNWHPLLSFEWEYNENGDLAVYRKFSGTLTWGEWIEQRRITYTYSDNDLEMVELSQIYIGGLDDLQNHQRQTYSTISELETEVLLESWVAVDWQWSTLTQVLYEDNRVAEEFVAEYDDEEGWLTNRHNVYSYTDGGLHDKTSGYSWVDDDWMLIYLEESIYDQNENLWSYSQYDWLQNSSMLSPTYVTEYGYGFAVLLSNTAVPYFMFNNALHTYQVTAKTSMTYLAGSAFNPVVNLYYYSEFNPTAVSEREALQVKVYPNPASNVVRLAADGVNGNIHVVIRNVSGSMVYSEVHSSQAEISVASMASGMYIYQIIAKDRQATGKLIVN